MQDQKAYFQQIDWIWLCFFSRLRFFKWDDPVVTPKLYFKSRSSDQLPLTLLHTRKMWFETRVWNYKGLKRRSLFVILKNSIDHGHVPLMTTIFYFDMQIEKLYLNFCRGIFPNWKYWDTIYKKILFKVDLTFKQWILPYLMAWNSTFNL